jgi:hypothetical protein
VVQLGNNKKVSLRKITLKYRVNNWKD